MLDETLSLVLSKKGRGRPSVNYLADDIVRLYNSGLNIREIAEKLEVCDVTVSKYLPKYIERRHGQKCGPRGPQNINREKKIVSYYKSHMTLREIGSIFNISYERVRQIISRFEKTFGVRLERNTAYTTRRVIGERKTRISK